MFMYGDFVEEYDPTSADSYRKVLEVDGVEITLDILDTAGQEEYAAMRDNYYRTGDGFLCVYAITNRESFASVKDFHSAILRVTEQTSIPFMLVGNKSDLEPSRQVTKNEGQDLASQHHWGFYETSAKAKTNVDDAFRELVKLVLDRKRSEPTKGDKKCILQ